MSSAKYDVFIFSACGDHKIKSPYGKNLTLSQARELVEYGKIHDMERGINDVIYSIVPCKR